jgi:hypothetical protein
MARKLLFKAVTVLLGVTALVVAGIPICLYWLGLSNIEGRPEPPPQTSDLVADGELLQRDLGTRDPIVIEPLNPWTFLVSTVYQSPNLRSEHGRSLRAVGIIAMNYNSNHIRDHRMIWWHLSEISLTIWLTRHWTTDEIITAAAALARMHPNPSVRR